MMNKTLPLMNTEHTDPSGRIIPLSDLCDLCKSVVKVWEYLWDVHSVS
jgi:hypothetical protein